MLCLAKIHQSRQSRKHKESLLLNQLRVKYDVFVSPVADFRVEDYTFEVGGKKKGLKQIQFIEKAFVVKDDIDFGYLKTIPH